MKNKAPISVLVAATCGLSSPWSAHAQQVTPGLVSCVNYLMQTGAFWGDRSNPRWQEPNAVWLCDGSKDTASPPKAVACFSKALQSTGNWGSAVMACRQARGLAPSTPEAVYKAVQHEAAAMMEKMQHSLGGGASPSGAPAAPDQGSASKPAKPKAQASQAQVTISFKNNVKQKVDLFFASPEGKWEHHYTLQPGDEIDQASYPGVEWRASADGKDLGGYDTTAEAQQSFVIGGAALASPTPSAQPLKPDPPARKQGGIVRPQDARMIEFRDGAFVKIAYDKWGEVDKKTGRIAFTFDPAGITDQSITIYDPGRKVTLFMDIAASRIFYKEDQDQAARPLYDIIGVSDQSRIPWSEVDWSQQGRAPEPAAPPAAPAPAPAPAAPPPIAAAPAPLVSGKAVMMVDAGDSAFVKIAGNQWGEVRKSDWALGFVFEEGGRTDQAVTLVDKSRNVVVQLDVANRKVLYADGGKALRPLYNIVAAADQSRIPGSTEAWEQKGQAPAAAPPPAPAPQPVAQSGASGSLPAAWVAEAAKAFDDGAYAFKNNRPCKDKPVAKLGPGERTASETLGTCRPFKTDQNEFVVDYRVEQLTFSSGGSPNLSVSSSVSSGSPKISVSSSGSPKLSVKNEPVFKAWLDSQGDLYLGISTQRNSVQIAPAKKTKLLIGPFLYKMNVVVSAASSGFEVQGTFPENAMGSSTVSRSVGYNLSFSAGANVGAPQATGLNAGVTGGYSDTNTVTAQQDDYVVDVIKTTPGRASFNWRLCKFGTVVHCDKGRLGDFTEKNALGVRNGDLTPPVKASFGIDGFKNDVIFKVTPSTIALLAQWPIKIIFDYSIITATVTQDRKWDKITTKPSTSTLGYRQIFSVDMRELAQIVLSNPSRF